MVGVSKFGRWDCADLVVELTDVEPVEGDCRTDRQAGEYFIGAAASSAKRWPTNGSRRATGPVAELEAQSDL